MQGFFFSQHGKRPASVCAGRGNGWDQTMDYSMDYSIDHSTEYLTCPEYEELKARYINGWKTWNVHSVLSYVHMPDALVLSLHLKEYRDGNFLRNALIGRFPTEDPEDATEILFPGDHAMDDSYTSIKVDWCGLELLVESAGREDLFALLVTPLRQQKKSARLYLEGGFLWNRPGSIRLDEESGAMIAKGEKIWVIETSGQAGCEDRNVPLTGPFLCVPADGPVAFIARNVEGGMEAAAENQAGAENGIEASAENRAGAENGIEASAENRAGAEIRKEDILSVAVSLVEEKKKQLEKRQQEAGELKWAMQALECAMSWDTIYDANRNRVISPVSRLWSIRKGGYVLFCWDNFFAGYLAGFVGRELAYSNVIEIVNERTDRGFIPNMSCGNGQKTLDRSQPPVGSRMVLELYRKYRDRWLVGLLYPALFEWNTWFYENRRSGSGALCWGSDPAPVIFGNRWEIDGVNGRFGGALESGLDNSPMYDDIPFDETTHRLKLEDVGLTGMFIMDCRALMELAEILSRREDLPVLSRRLEAARQGLEQLWDEERGFYYNRRTDTGEFSRRISPANFYALFSQDIPDDRIQRILQEHYYNPEEFYGEWMLPSIARNDPAYPDQDYWRGRVWAPLNFLVYLAFEQHGLREACEDLAAKSTAIFLPEWEEHRHVHENYNSITGEGCDAHNSDKFYHWGALLAAIALRNNGRMKDDIR